MNIFKKGSLRHTLLYPPLFPWSVSSMKLSFKSSRPVGIFNYSLIEYLLVPFFRPTISVHYIARPLTMFGVKI
jgi:hypothetical protein